MMVMGLTVSVLLLCPLVLGVEFLYRSCWIRCHQVWD